MTSLRITPSEADKSRFATQREKVLDYLLSGNNLSEDSARRMFGIRRCAARISELRKAGFLIRTEMVSTGAGVRVASWSINPRKPRKEDQKPEQCPLPFSWTGQSVAESARESHAFN